MSKHGPFESVVLAGGGSRTVWHAGFFASVTEPLQLRPRQIAAVSAAAAMACAIVTGTAEIALENFKEATSKNPRNAHWGNTFKSGARVFPHEAMFRAAILEVFEPEVFARLKSGPTIRVQLGRLPPWAGPRTALLAAFAAYKFDKHVRRLVHPRTAAAIGFRLETVDVAECETAEDLADLVLQSSCTPPMTRLLERDGRPVLDGGVVDSVPVQSLDDAPGETLVMLTRPALKLPQIDGRTYVQPSQPVGISAWDYANPQGLQRAYDLGRRDGDSFARSWLEQGSCPP